MANKNNNKNSTGFVPVKLSELFKVYKVTVPATIRKLQRAVRRIFLLGSSSETKNGLKKFTYKDITLLQQNPETSFGKKLIENHINTKRVFWIMKGKKYLGVVVFRGRDKTKVFVYPKSNDNINEILSILE